MKIVHIQKSMQPAGNAAYRLSCAMRKYGIDSYVLNLCPSVIKDNVYSLNRNIKTYFWGFIDKSVKKIRKRFKIRGTYFYNSMPLIGVNVSKNPLIQNADVIYIHWVAGCLSESNWNQLAALNKPIIVFMHDMWPFTGGCNHSMGCLKYCSDCSKCSMFAFNNSSVPSQLEMKIKIYSENHNIHFISPSKWMTGTAQNSIALKTKVVYNIPNVVDENLFRPMDKYLVRKKLNLPQDKKIIAFGCQAGQKNPFKGWVYLEKAINMVKRDDISIIIYGSDYNEETVKKVKYPIIFLGKIGEENILPLICNAADIFVTPSLCENYSLTILENLLCGTPVVGFDTTGIPEMVKTGETGYLAKFKSSNDLAKGIEFLLSSKIKLDFREKYSTKKIVESHIRLINSIIER